MTKELLGENQPIPENWQQDIYVLSCRNAAQQDNLAPGPNQLGDLRRIAASLPQK